MLVKTVIEKETVDHKGDPKIVFIMEDDIHGVYQTEVVLDPLHRAFVDTKTVALLDVIKPILLARFDAWVKVKDKEKQQQEEEEAKKVEANGKTIGNKPKSPFLDFKTGYELIM